MTRFIPELSALFPLLAMASMKAAALCFLAVCALARARDSLRAACRVRIAFAVLLSLPFLAIGILPINPYSPQDESPLTAPTRQTAQAHPDQVHPDQVIAENANQKPENIGMAISSIMTKPVTDRTFPLIRLSPSIGAAVVLIWMSVALLLLVRFLAVRVNLASRIASYGRVTGGPWLDMLKKNWACMGKGPMPILLDLPDGCPVLARSAGKTYMLVPAADPEWTEQERHAAVMHECAHAVRRDLDMMVVMDLISCASWHVPFVGTLVNFVERDREEACDELAMKRGVSPRNLASLLLELRAPYRRSSLPGTQGVRGMNDIERRILMIMNKREQNAGRSRRSLVGVSLALIAIAIMLFTVPQIFAEQKPEVSEVPPVERLALAARDSLNPMGTTQITLPLTVVPVAVPVDGEGWHQSLGFGKQVHPFTKKDFFHLGSDISNYRAGAHVLSTIDGIVVASEYNQDLGNYVVIQEKDIIVLYAHLAKLSVTAGTTVIKGTVIGTVGNTGISTGPHLHYEIHLLESGEEPVVTINGQIELSGIALDPLPLLYKSGLLL